jgi:hypothetical protein
MMKTIEEIPGKNPFKVPDKYFEEVNRKIILATTGKYNDIKKPGIYRKFRPYILAAASFTGFLIISYLAARSVLNDRTESASKVLYTAASNESFLIDIDLLTLEENASIYEFTEGLPEIKKSEIIDYLMLENIELDDINEDL